MNRTKTNGESLEGKKMDLKFGIVLNTPHPICDERIQSRTIELCSYSMGASQV